MSKYTPTTSQAKRAYVTGMRQAFIASSGEHAEEFDRFLAQVRAEALREAADWKREHNLGHSVWGDYLKRLADEKYHAGGDDMVTIWLYDRADRILDKNPTGE